MVHFEPIAQPAARVVESLSAANDRRRAADKIIAAQSRALAAAHAALLQAREAIDKAIAEIVS